MHTSKTYDAFYVSEHPDWNQNFVEVQAMRQGLTVEQRNAKYRSTPLTHYKKSFFDELGLETSIIDMPDYYPDSEFKTFSVVIDKNN